MKIIIYGVYSDIFDLQIGYDLSVQVIERVLMVFSSITFLFIYLPVVLALYFLAPLKMRNVVLFLVSLLFYAWGEPKFVFVMLLVILINWISGLLIEKSASRTKQKHILIDTLVIDLGILGFFKYTDFIIANLNLLGLNLKQLNIDLPIGISFYVFQAMTYPIDLYKQEIQPQNSFVKFGTYVSMFPQLIAGPIVRYSDIAPQLTDRKINETTFAEGIIRFVCGLCKKVLLANTIGSVSSSISSLPSSEVTVVSCWLGSICFMFQLYFDFSGYSDMAIGLGKMLGFDFKENFNYPFTAESVTDFWRRWHISLSSFFRDYVYIPLGGNHKGLARQIMNIVIVWFLTGLWHGASWNFVIWGLINGFLLILEKTFLLKVLKKQPSWVRHIYTGIAILIAFVFFNYTDLPQALSCLSGMFGSTGKLINGAALYFIRDNLFLILICCIASTPVLQNTKIKNNHVYQSLSPFFIIFGLVLSTAFIISSTYNPFLYFRF